MTPARTAVLRQQMETLAAKLAEAVQVDKAAALQQLYEAQAEYVASDAARRLACATALREHAEFTAEELAEAMGYAGRRSVYQMARSAGEGEFPFGPDVLADLRAVASRYRAAMEYRTRLIYTLRDLPEPERPPLQQMADVMGVTREGVRYFLRDRERARR